MGVGEETMRVNSALANPSPGIVECFVKGEQDDYMCMNVRMCKSLYIGLRLT